VAAFFIHYFSNATFKHDVVATTKLNFGIPVQLQDDDYDTKCIYARPEVSLLCIAADHPLCM